MKTASGLVLFLALLGVWLWAPTPEAAKAANNTTIRCGSTQVLGHRGTKSNGVKENTLTAFQLAVRQGVQRIEFDMHRTKDGQWVVWHDARLNGRQISRYKYKKLKTIEPQLATYSQVMSYLGGRPGIWAYPEIKPSSVATSSLRYLHRVARQYGMTRRTEWQSFHPAVLKKFAKANKGRIYRLMFVLNKPKSVPVVPRLTSVAVHNNLVRSQKFSVSGARKRGLKVYVYTPNTQHEWESFTDKVSVDGVITDYAAAWTSWCKQAPAPQPAPPTPTTPPVDTTPADPTNPAERINPDAPVEHGSGIELQK